MSSNLGIWIVRDEAKKVGRFLQKSLGGKLGGSSRSSGELKNRDAFSASFADHSQWILVMPTAIAVRYLAGLTRHKSVDPGIVVLDEACRFAVSLIGGHQGGANSLAYQVANLTGAIPVITTASETLKPLVVGIGCRKGVRADQIAGAVAEGLGKVSRSETEIREIATIDLKGSEEGILQWCEQLDLPLRLIPRSLIRERPWVFASSRLVHAHLGIEGVCEPCALLATSRGRLILRRITRDGVALAIAEEALGI